MEEEPNEPNRRKPYTLGEAAKVLTERLGYEVSHQMVWHYVRTAQLKSLPRASPRGWYRVPVSELERFIKSRTLNTS